MYSLRVAQQGHIPGAENAIDKHAAADNVGAPEIQLGNAPTDAYAPGDDPKDSIVLGAGSAHCASLMKITILQLFHSNMHMCPSLGLQRMKLQSLPHQAGSWL